MATVWCPRCKCLEVIDKYSPKCGHAGAAGPSGRLGTGRK